MAVELLDDTEPSALSPCIPFAAEAKYNANAAEQNRDAATMAEVRLRYPYPPASCDEATTILQNLDSDIAQANEKIASAASDRVAKRYLDAFLTVRGEFKNWLNGKKCVQTAMQADDQAFTQQLQNALDQESASQTGTSDMDNLIIFGSLALLLIAAGVIIYKKTKARKAA